MLWTFTEKDDLVDEIPCASMNSNISPC